VRRSSSPARTGRASSAAPALPYGARSTGFPKPYTERQLSPNPEGAGPEIAGKAPPPTARPRAGESGPRAVSAAVIGERRGAETTPSGSGFGLHHISPDRHRAMERPCHARTGRPPTAGPSPKAAVRAVRPRPPSPPHPAIDVPHQRPSNRPAATPVGARVGEPARVPGGRSRPARQIFHPGVPAGAFRHGSPDLLPKVAGALPCLLPGVVVECRASPWAGRAPDRPARTAAARRAVPRRHGRGDAPQPPGRRCARQPPATAVRREPGRTGSDPPPACPIRPPAKGRPRCRPAAAYAAHGHA